MEVHFNAAFMQNLPHVLLHGSESQIEIPITFFSKHLSFLFWRNLFKAASLCENWFFATPLLLAYPMSLEAPLFAATPLSLSTFVPLPFTTRLLMFCPLLPWLLPEVLPFKL